MLYWLAAPIRPPPPLPTHRFRLRLTVNDSRQLGVSSIGLASSCSRMRSSASRRSVNLCIFIQMRSAHSMISVDEKNSVYYKITVKKISQLGPWFLPETVF